ncbi:hypothetical protein C8R45DRAFT_926549 [Mycena sanguinolenta]|nr:hypothetical protein C8R45DRAFT_926549 [Mycena sanguinolenta]
MPIQTALRVSAQEIILDEIKGVGFREYAWKKVLPIPEAFKSSTSVAGEDDLAKLGNEVLDDAITDAVQRHLSSDAEREASSFLSAVVDALRSPETSKALMRFWGHRKACQGCDFHTKEASGADSGRCFRIYIGTYIFSHVKGRFRVIPLLDHHILHLAQKVAEKITTSAAKRSRIDEEHARTGTKKQKIDKCRVSKSQSKSTKILGDSTNLPQRSSSARHSSKTTRKGKAAKSKAGQDSVRSSATTAPVSSAIPAPILAFGKPDYLILPSLDSPVPGPASSNSIDRGSSKCGE